MKELQFLYSMQIQFDSPITKHRFTLKCLPLSDSRQQVSNLDIDVYPREFLSMDEDSFGNSCIYGYAEGEHEHFSIIVTGTAKTGLERGVPVSDVYKIGIFKYQTPYTEAGPQLLQFHDAIGLPEDAGNLEKASCYMDVLYKYFQYVPGVTTIQTTAEEAFSLGKGVCQDYAHILLSLCRLDHIPSRYVVGLLLGEGASHAWVEVYDNGFWIGLDPTNHCMVEENHIKMSNGRDFKDCTINQGMFLGTAVQCQKVRVKVTDKKEGFKLL